MGHSNKRAGVRFGAMYRVDYQVAEHPTFAFTRDVSATGMMIRGTRGLEIGADIFFTLHLSRDERLGVAGRIVRAQGSDVGVAFSATPEDIARLRAFIDTELVGRIADRLKHGAGLERVAELATYYLENDRIDEALELYHFALGKKPSDISLYETVAELLGKRITAVDDTRAEALLGELDAIVERGLVVGDSAILCAAKIDAAALRLELERRRRVQLSGAHATMEQRWASEHALVEALSQREAQAVRDRDRLQAELDEARERAAAQLSSEREGFAAQFAAERERLTTQFTGDRDRLSTQLSAARAQANAALSSERAAAEQAALRARENANELEAQIKSLQESIEQNEKEAASKLAQMQEDLKAAVRARNTEQTWHAKTAVESTKWRERAKALEKATEQLKAHAPLDARETLLGEREAALATAEAALASERVRFAEERTQLEIEHQDLSRGLAELQQQHALAQGRWNRKFELLQEERGEVLALKREVDRLRADKDS